MELSIIKNDVIAELRTRRYYNEQEITRLVKSDSLSHENRVKRIVDLTKENVAAIEAIKLIELYFPTVKQQEIPTPANNFGDGEVGQEAPEESN